MNWRLVASVAKSVGGLVLIAIVIVAFRLSDKDTARPREDGTVQSRERDLHSKERNQAVVWEKTSQFHKYHVSMSESARKETRMAALARNPETFNVTASIYSFDRDYIDGFFYNLRETYEQFETETSSISTDDLPDDVRNCFTGIQTQIKRQNDMISKAMVEEMDRETFVKWLGDWNAENESYKNKVDALAEVAKRYHYHIQF